MKPSEQAIPFTLGLVKPLAQSRAWGRVIVEDVMWNLEIIQRGISRKTMRCYSIYFQSSKRVSQDSKLSLPFPAIASLAEAIGRHVN